MPAGGFGSVRQPGAALHGADDLPHDGPGYELRSANGFKFRTTGVAGFIGYLRRFGFVRFFRYV